MINNIVVASDKFSLHLVNVCERSIAVLDDICVIKVMVGCEEDSHSASLAHPHMPHYGGRSGADNGNTHEVPNCAPEGQWLHAADNREKVCTVEHLASDAICVPCSHSD